MSTFTSQLSYKLTSSGLARITKPVRFYMNDTLDGEYIELFPGALTNFATIPKGLQWLFPHDAEDYKMASAFHDGLVEEWGQQIWIMHNEDVSHKPTWQESAYWFREMMCVRQANTRRRVSFWFKPFILVIDFITRWVFWVNISLYGLSRGVR